MTHWHIIQVKGGMEDNAEARLEALGYPETFCPRKDVDLRPRGKIARARGAKPKWGKRPYVAGYVFVCTPDIRAHVINEDRHGRLWMRVLSPGGVPYVVTDKQMARMRDVPERIKQLVDEVKRQELEARAARRPQVGGKAQIIEGPFAGMPGTVHSITGDSVTITIGSQPVTTTMDNAEKVA